MLVKNLPLQVLLLMKYFWKTSEVPYLTTVLNVGGICISPGPLGWKDVSISSQATTFSLKPFFAFTKNLRATSLSICYSTKHILAFLPLKCCSIFNQTPSLHLAQLENCPQSFLNFCLIWLLFFQFIQLLAKFKVDFFLFFSKLLHNFVLWVMFILPNFHVFPVPTKANSFRGNNVSTFNPYCLGVSLG